VEVDWGTPVGLTKPPNRRADTPSYEAVVFSDSIRAYAHATSWAESQVL